MDREGKRQLVPVSFVHIMTRLRIIKLGIACLLVAASTHAQSKEPILPASSAVGVETPASPNLLRDLDSSLEKVVAKVAPAVVQIVVNGYGPLEDRAHTDTSRIVRQHAIGAGVIVDSDGYIITNAHVVEGAERIRVILPPQANVVTIPEPAVDYSVYGESAYRLTAVPDKKDPQGKPVYKAEQTFVTLGSRFDGKVAVLKGVNHGDLVVVGGQLKLHNGAEVILSDQKSLQNTGVVPKE